MIMLPLYLLCLALELVHVLARFLVAYGIARALGVGEDPAAWIAGVVAFLPRLRSLTTYFFPLPGGWGLLWELGARRPSPCEKETVKPVLDELRRRGAKTPVTWFVIDDPLSERPDAPKNDLHQQRNDRPSITGCNPCARVRSHCHPHRRPAARPGPSQVPGLRLLRIYLETEGWPITAKNARVISGGASWELPIIRSLWAAYLRRAEHAADRYAKKLGYSYELVEYLDVYERSLDGASPFRRGRSHPYAEQRIGRLMREP